MAFSNAASYGAAKSNPLNFTLPAIPKTNIECTSPQSTYSGTTFSISCTSTISLASTPVNIILVRSASSDVLGGTIANGNKFEIPDVKIESVGVAKLQVSTNHSVANLRSKIDRCIFKLTGFCLNFLALQRHARKTTTIERRVLEHSFSKADRKWNDISPVQQQQDLQDWLHVTPCTMRVGPVKNSCNFS
jgi:hypothetical protein